MPESYTVSHSEKTTFSKLISGTSMETFWRDIFERRVLHSVGCLSSKDISELMTLKRVDEILTGYGMYHPKVELITDGTTKTDISKLRRPNGEVDGRFLAKRFSEGSSIRIARTQTVDKAVAELCRKLANELRIPIGCNLYFTPEGNQGFAPHYDDHDTLIVQCHGEKNWSIYSTYNNMTYLPPSGQRFDPTVHTNEVFDRQHTLGVGDTIYIPRGVMHSAKATQQSSVHLTLSLNWHTWGDLLMRALAAVMVDNQYFRRAIPSEILMKNRESERGNEEVLQAIRELEKSICARECLDELDDYWLQDAIPALDGVFIATARGDEGIEQCWLAISREFFDKVIRSIKLSAPLIVGGDEVDLQHWQIRIVQLLEEEGPLRFSRLISEHPCKDKNAIREFILELMLDGFVQANVECQ